MGILLIGNLRDKKDMKKILTGLGFILLMTGCSSVQSQVIDGTGSQIIGASHVRSADLEDLALRPQSCYHSFKANSLLRQVKCQPKSEELVTSRKEQ